MDHDQEQLRHEISNQYFKLGPNINSREDFLARPFAIPLVPVNQAEMSIKAESVGLGIWREISRPITAPSPVTTQETVYPYWMLGQYTTLSLWDPSTVPIRQMHHEMQQTYAANQDLYPPSTMEESRWSAKPRDDGVYLQDHVIDRNVVNDLRYTGPGVTSDYPTMDQSHSHRRMSGSSFTGLTSGASSQTSSNDDFSATSSAATSFSSDFPPPSNRGSPASPTDLSQMASMEMTPHPSIMSSRPLSQALPTAQIPPTMSNLPTQKHPYQLPNITGFQNNTMLLSPHSSKGIHEPQHQLENLPSLLPQAAFRTLQSNADAHAIHSHCTDLSKPPDLYASLQEEQVPPPPEDMNPSDSDLVPYKQELRFNGDLYTPLWVRGHGDKREGWCGICKPGRWLVLKNSAFWYDKSFTHGISAATGSHFQEPQEMRRMDGNLDVWEGQCSSCNKWIALVSSKKRGTPWFRHAYKCHAHPKIKDSPKRHRKSNHTRGPGTELTASQKPKRTHKPRCLKRSPLAPARLHQQKVIDA